MVQRATKETDVSVSVELDGEGRADVETPLPFLSHMLEQIARHGGVDLVVFPELATTGYPPRDLLLRRQFVESNLDLLNRLESGRPGGDDWEAARAADRAAALAGKTPTALAKLLAGDHSRYAAALAAASTCRRR